MKVGIGRVCCGVLSVGCLLGACAVAFAAPIRVASPDGEDASSSKNPQSYRIFERRVGKTDGMDVVIAPGGGFVMEIEKVDE